VRNNQRFGDLLKRISSGTLNSLEVRDEIRRFSEQETAEYIRTLTTMGINFFTGLLELNQSFNERFFQRLGNSHEGADEPAAESHGTLSLRGLIRCCCARPFYCGEPHFQGLPTWPWQFRPCGAPTDRPFKLRFWWSPPRFVGTAGKSVKWS
jgi:hypothetical protein